MANIIPSILEKDINEIQNKLKQLNDLVELAQIDLADGEFVDNILISKEELSRLESPIIVEAHLMVANPEEWIPYLNPDIFKRAYFHIESAPEPENIILKLKELDIEPGIAINLDTPLDKLIAQAERVDSILFMSVDPGYQGQEFNHRVLEKIEKFIYQFPDHLIAIDGGINEKNILEVIKVGVDNISIGSELFAEGNVVENLNKFNNIIN